MLKKLFSSVSKKMSIDFEEITSQINHNGEKGNAREDVLQSYLRGYIPDKYTFSKGTIIDCTGSQSKQVDIIIHDKYITPCLVGMDSTKVIPIESVYAVIEVKSVLTKEELRKSIKNINSVKTLQKNTVTGFSYPTAGLIFAYDSDSSFNTIYKNLVELSQEFEPENRVSCVCVLNKGIIIPINKHGLNKVSLLPSLETVYALMNNEEDALLLFYLILMQLLTQIKVFPPNMVTYAQSSEMLDTSYNIPAGYVPDDAIIDVLNTQIAVADLKGLSDSAQKMLSGEVKKSEILECIFNTYIPKLKRIHENLENIPDNSILDYFGQTISNRQLVAFYNIYQKGENATPSERIELKKFEDFLYDYYEMHSEEMKRNAKK